MPGPWRIGQADYQARRDLLTPDGDLVTAIRASDVIRWECRSPAHAIGHLRRDWEEPVTRAMELGRLRHSLLLREPDWEQRHIIVEAPSFRSRLAQRAAEIAREQGKTPICRPEFQAQERVIDSLRRARPKLVERIAQAQREYGIVWSHNGVWFRALHDAISEDALRSWDLKTVVPSPVYGLNTYPARSMESLEGLLRIGQYLASMLAVNGGQACRLSIVALENVPPYHSALFCVDSDGHLGIQALDAWRNAASDIAGWHHASNRPFDDGKIDGIIDWPRSYDNQHL